VSSYYDQRFEAIEQGGSKVGWNWAAFFFTGLWYFYKGMWAKGLLFFFLVVATAIFIFPPFLLWIYCGVFGSYDLYLLKTKAKQLW
jgi:hypothetical protein